MAEILVLAPHLPVAAGFAMVPVPLVHHAVQLMTVLLLLVHQLRLISAGLRRSRRLNRRGSLANHGTAYDNSNVIAKI